MRYISAILLTFVFILVTGCGGGSDDGGFTLPPSTHDLSGLEGTWTVNLSFTGTLNTPTGPSPISDSGVGTWVISSIGINSGFPLEWSYNGTTLYIQWESTAGDWSQECGTEITVAEVQLQINISPGDDYADIAGIGTMLRTTTECGDSSGTLTYMGSMTKGS
ncbi:hypothetical protein J7L05_10100 [bacterium]|nr:hypothetical protein [bacterium]